jgi:hypothetical protein
MGASRDTRFRDGWMAERMDDLSYAIATRKHEVMLLERDLEIMLEVLATRTIEEA